jgi:uncharacterized protein YndB with AHSA1/START domain
MALNQYTFLTTWRIPATPDEVWPLIANMATYPTWWGKVYKEVQPIGNVAGLAVGNEYRIHSKGYLPYHLYFTVRIEALEPPHRVLISASGDFIGTGEWTVKPNGEMTEANLDWRISTGKSLLNLLAPVARPLFATNHNWAMQRGEEGLRAYLTGARSAAGQT